MAKKNRADSKRSEISEEQVKREAQEEIAQYEGLYIKEEDLLEKLERQSAEIDAQEAQTPYESAAQSVQEAAVQEVPQELSEQH